MMIGAARVATRAARTVGPCHSGVAKRNFGPIPNLDPAALSSGSSSIPATLVTSPPAGGQRQTESRVDFAKEFDSILNANLDRMLGRTQQPTEQFTQEETELPVLNPEIHRAWRALLAGRAEPAQISELVECFGELGQRCPKQLRKHIFDFSESSLTDLAAFCWFGAGLKYRVLFNVCGSFWYT